MSTLQRPTIPKAQPKTRRGFASMLMIMASLFGANSQEWKKARSQGYRTGKHNGANRGAFGGQNGSLRMYVQRMQRERKQHQHA